MTLLMLFFFGIPLLLLAIFSCIFDVMREMAKEYPRFTIALLSSPILLVISNILDAFIERLGIGTTLFILYLSLVYIVAILYLIKKHFDAIR